MAAMANKVGAMLMKGAELAKVHGQPKLLRFWQIAKVELAPPSLADGPQITKGFKEARDLKRISSLTMKQVMVNGAVCFEIFLCYHIGRILGKRSLVGFSRIGYDECNSYPAIKKP